MQNLVVFLLSLFVSFSVHAFEGEYQAVDLGCATPLNPQYNLEIQQSVFPETKPNAKTQRWPRAVTVRSYSSSGAGYRYDCTVQYEGFYQISGKVYNGELKRVDCNCGELKGDNAEALCRRGDAYVLEASNTPLSWQLVDRELITKQLVSPQRALPGCGDTYPEFVFKEI